MRNAGVMLIVNGDGKILSISRRNNKTKFGLPGGKLEENESPQDAAIRETHEETGVLVTSCELIYVRVEPKELPDGEDFNTHCYYAVLWDESNLKKSSDEGEVKWLTSKELTSPEWGAFPEYNANTLKEFKNKYPEIKVL